MRQFMKHFQNLTNSLRIVENLTWTNIRQIMRLKNKAEREYYIKEASEQRSSRVLERNIKTGYYRRLLSSQQPLKFETDKQNPIDFIMILCYGIS